MAIFRLPVYARKKDRTSMQEIFVVWGSLVRKKTYYLVSWKTISTSIEQGELGIINLKLMNKTLLCK
jgi:hypothetical protein